MADVHSTPADSDDAHLVLSPSATGERGTVLVEMVTDTYSVEVPPGALPALIEWLRARVVGGTDGPDQGDPAAWGVVEPGRGVVHTEADDEACGFWINEYASEDAYAVPLYLRAPGAVAAAPPGDEEVRNATAAVRHAVAASEDERAADYAYDLLTRGWRLVPPAPPAGHEDEAAVERAARAIFAAGGFVPSWDDCDEQWRAICRDRARAALAAARGPRTLGSARG